MLSSSRVPAQACLFLMGATPLYLDDVLESNSVTPMISGILT